MKTLVATINRNKAIRIIYQLSCQLIQFPFYLLGFLVFRREDIWVFGNIFGYCDNARYLFEYINSNHKDIRAVWINYSRVPRNKCNFNVLWRYSFQGILLQYRAGVSFVSTGMGDLAKFTLGGSKIVQLWHGVPIKKILLDSPESLPFSKKWVNLNKIFFTCFKTYLQRYSLVIASSPLVQQRMMSAFGLQIEKVGITGYPRHDIILSSSRECKRKILYAPTWRKNNKNAKDIITSLCTQEFMNGIREKGYRFDIAIHPLNSDLLPDLQSFLCGDINLLIDHDINEVLAGSEVLITDYSSIAIDFMMLSRKIIFYVPDYDKYSVGRGMYPEFKTLIKDNFAQDYKEVLRKIDQEFRLESISPEKYISRRDSLARERIVIKVKTL